MSRQDETGQAGSIFHVRLRSSANGGAVTGDWYVRPTAERKFTEWIGTYGSLDHVVIQLIEETDAGQETVLKTWTKERGEVVGAL
ncbi:hypothetical protein OHA44_37630 [Streptomyces sp. NBC_00144]|uniref:hypothetical protein n=1 Tax=Streptomyces sp. NBC_00144 TaxID=2975665 RepID=UPI003245CDCC